MTINDKDIGMYNARQHNVTFDHNSISNDSEWQDGAVLPLLRRNTIGFKNMTIRVIVKGDGREEIIRNTSSLLGMLMGPVVLGLDDYNHKFKGVLKSYKTNELSMKRFHALELTFECYEFGEMVSKSGIGSIQIYNPGNIESPCRLSVTPAASSSYSTISGISRGSKDGEELDVTIDEMTSGQEIVLDGINGIFTIDGSPDSGIDIWTLPALKPGLNEIVCSAGTAAMTCDVMPMYM